MRALGELLLGTLCHWGNPPGFPGQVQDSLSSKRGLPSPFVRMGRMEASSVQCCGTGSGFISVTQISFYLPVSYPPAAQGASRVLH